MIFLSLKRRGVCVCVCACVCACVRVHIFHMQPSSSWLCLTHRSFTEPHGQPWVRTGCSLNLSRACARRQVSSRSAQSPGPQQSCCGSYGVSVSSLFSQGFLFVNCLLQMSPTAQAAATEVLACVSGGQLLPPWIRPPPGK